MERSLEMGRRLKKLKKSRGFSQETLAYAAKVTKKTIYRLEKGTHEAQSRTLKKLADALRVDPGVLTGDLPMPPDVEKREPRPLLTRIFPPAHNALTLTAWRYGIPRARIVELAPLLFVMAAEASLTRRRQAADAVAKGALTDATGAWLTAERASIAARDILGERAQADAGDAMPGWSNPFAQFLREGCHKLGDGTAEFISFDRTSANYWVCSDDAMELAANDEGLHEWILFAEFMLSGLPAKLRAPDQVAARQVWMREALDRANVARQTADGAADLEELGDDE